MSKRTAKNLAVRLDVDKKLGRRQWMIGDTPINASLLRSLPFSPAQIRKVEATVNPMERKALVNSFRQRMVEDAIMSIEDDALCYALCVELNCEWGFWARNDQLLPAGEWRHIIALAGRGWGKTRYGAEAVIEWHRQGYKYVNIIGPTYDDAWGVMVEGESGILAVCPPHLRPTVNLKKGLIWPNGAITRVFTAQEPERLRGKQHQKVWADELCAWQYPEAWDQMKFGLRLRSPRGAPVTANQVVVTTTPKPSKLLRKLLADPQSYVIRGSTNENVENLSPDFYNDMLNKYAGTRLARQELDAEVLDDNVGALWNLDAIHEGRRYKVADDGRLMLPEMRRIVVAIDPAVTANSTSDETGIVVAGLGVDGHGYVLEDGTADERISSDKWAARAVRRYHRWQADRIIGEVNNGGDLIEMVLRAYGDSNISYKSVRASRGKVARAEPVADLYSRGLVHHCGVFNKLEQQMTEYNPTVDKKSPDRMDALVWALTELMLGENELAVLDYYSDQISGLTNVHPSELRVAPVSALTRYENAGECPATLDPTQEVPMSNESKNPNPSKRGKLTLKPTVPAPLPVQPTFAPAVEQEAAQTLTPMERLRLVATSKSREAPPAEKPKPGLVLPANRQAAASDLESDSRLAAQLALIDKMFGDDDRTTSEEDD